MKDKFLNKLNKIIPIIFLLIPLFSIKTSLDNDIWFILNHGRYIVNNPNNPFISIEPFTVHTELSFSFQKWLSSLIFYYVYSFAGEFGILVIIYLIGLLIEYIFYKTLNIFSNNKIINIIITSITCSLLFNSYLVSRPQIFSYICLLLEFYCLEKYIKTKDCRYLSFLPIISLLYMQLHSTMWLMFFVMLMPYLFDFSLISNVIKCIDEKYYKKPIYFFAFLSFIIGMANPYFLTSITYTLNSSAISSLNILELNSPNVLQIIIMGGFYFVIVICLISIFIYRYDVNKNTYENPKPYNIYFDLPLRFIYFILGLFILGIMAVRNLSYVCLYSGLIAGYFYKNFKFNEFRKILPKSFNKISNTLYKCFIIYFLILLCVIINPYKNIYSQTSGYNALNYLKEEVKDKEIKLFTEFNTGSYAEWLGFRTYFDPRAEVFVKELNNKEDLISEYLNIFKSGNNYIKIQNKYDFDYWLLSKSNNENSNIKSDNNYELIYNDEYFYLYKVRRI